jgi:pimeloyl-ACP methyl ester carboxylesterase
MKAEPFKIEVESLVLQDLARRLRHARWADGFSDDGWKFGTSSAYLKELVAYWTTQFDWKKEEASLNRLPHFKADVNGDRIHFIHQRGQRGLGETRVPLLLLHGWPDSFYRYYKAIPRLAAPGEHGGDPAEAFDVVVPSLPGFGFTGPLRLASTQQPNRRSAEVLWKLMTEVLGYRRFAVAGGDGGGALAQILAIDHPDSIVGIHLTDLGWHVGDVDPSTLSKEERKHVENGKKQFMADGAYAMLQSTKPQSLAPALTDSPVALASWIVDRFHSWSDSGGDIERSFTKDELLTNIMIYWVTQTIGPSMSTYRADRLSPSLTTADHVRVPVGLALFPKDIGGIPPRSFAERTLNVRRWTEMPRGGHFAALEEPELFARDVTAFFRELAAVRRQRPRGEEHVR